MSEIIVDQIMKKPVYTVKKGTVVAEALEIMREKGVKKILVKADDKLMGVLESWKILRADLEKKVEDLELSQVKEVPVGTKLSDIESDLLKYPAIYIYKPDKPNDPVGVITAYDLARAY
ncbi:MAG: CBS domain-containing protein [Thermoplasmata archaeon]|nr:MAG: CBS domain-containing protein [Thermoplasmata archaeon]